MSIAKPQPLPREITGMCSMFGITPPRLLTRTDINRIYKRFPLTAEAVWKNVEAIQAKRNPK